MAQTQAYTARDRLKCELHEEEIKRIFSGIRGIKLAFVEVGPRDGEPVDGRVNTIKFVAECDGGNTSFGFHEILDTGEINKIKEIDSIVTSIARGQREELAGHDLDDFHRGIIERRREASRLKTQQFRLAA